MHKNLFPSLIFIFLLSLGCSSDDDPTTPSLPTYEYLEDYTMVQEVSETSLENLYRLVLGEDAPSVTWEKIEMYRVAYQTEDFSGEEVTASGLLLLPANRSASFPLISYQHGTLLNDNQAPSVANLFNNETAIGSLLAGHGFGVAMPDYLGYQRSRDIPHPYEEQSTLGQTSYDMLQASKELIESLEASTTNDLFLVGYSEGGYATMALHRKIETENAFSVSHSFPGAGAYNKTAFSQAVLERNEELPFMTTYLWVLFTYNNLYPQLQRPWDQMVQAPYVSLFENFDPLSLSLADLAQIPQNPQELFLASFIEGIVNGTDTAFMEVLAANDNFDWEATAPISLYHGSADDYVWPLNSSTAFEAMTERGNDVNYYSLEGLNHSTAVGPYITAVLSAIQSELE